MNFTDSFICKDCGHALEQRMESEWERQWNDAQEEIERFREALLQVRAILNPTALPDWIWNPTRSADALRVISAALTRTSKT